MADCLPSPKMFQNEQLAIVKDKLRNDLAITWADVNRQESTPLFETPQTWRSLIRDLVAVKDFSNKAVWQTQANVEIVTKKISLYHVTVASESLLALVASDKTLEMVHPKKTPAHEYMYVVAARLAELKILLAYEFMGIDPSNCFKIRTKGIKGLPFSSNDYNPLSTQRSLDAVSDFRDALVTVSSKLREAKNEASALLTTLYESGNHGDHQYLVT